MPKETLNETLITGTQTYATLDEAVTSIVLTAKKHSKQWYIIAACGLLGTIVCLLGSIVWLVYQGVGIWGNNWPVMWSFDIVNFVWWIGIGHAGTLISAILLLLRQNWRNSINRFAEAMTIFAVMCAGIYPLLHTGRPWVAMFWLFPYPNIMGMWPQFRSPLMWDVFAVSTYFLVSLAFWLMGLIPDFATIRDRAKSRWVKVIFGLLAIGWRGSNQHWHRYEQAYLLLAGISTPLVLSVHTIVSFDFAASQVPGWNVTVFPPYFVAGAVFAGFAMVLTLAIPVRALYKLKDLITLRHLDWMAKVMLATGMIVCYGYALEIFFAFYAGTPYELGVKSIRMNSVYQWNYYALIFCNLIAIQPLWLQSVRTSPAWLLGISIFVSIGMWLERFVIIPMSLMNGFLPATNQPYYPTFWDFFMFIGTLFFFTMMMWLFIRFLPVVNIFEMKDLLYKIKTKEEAEKAKLAEAAKVGGAN